MSWFETDFNKITERRGTNSVKYDMWKQEGLPEDILPLWVADMDFPAPKPVLERLRELTDHGIFGYGLLPEGYFKAVKNWFADRHGWEPERRWMVQTPGVVFALATTVRAFTRPGEGVLIQRPVYYPFSNVIEANGRKLVNNALRLEGGRYVMDLEDLEAKLAQEDTKLMFLCNPHNPVGRVWTRDEVLSVARLCLQYGVPLVCDEIHCDFVYHGHKHTSAGTFGGEILENTVICTAPSKTFNLAGLQVSNIFLPGKELRHAFKDELKRQGMGGVNVMGMAACQAAYEEGGPWVDDLVVYLGRNINALRYRLEKRMPQIKLIEPEGTYLAWLDLRELGFDEVDQKDFIVNKAKLWLDTGSMFGEEGAGFERVNMACPRGTLREALDRLEKAYGQLEEKKE